MKTTAFKKTTILTGALIATMGMTTPLLAQIRTPFDTITTQNTGTETRIPNWITVEQNHVVAEILWMGTRSLTEPEEQPLRRSISGLEHAITMLDETPERSRTLIALHLAEIELLASNEPQRARIVREAITVFRSDDIARIRGFVRGQGTDLRHAGNPIIARQIERAADSLNDAATNETIRNVIVATTAANLSNGPQRHLNVAQNLIEQSTGTQENLQEILTQSMNRVADHTNRNVFQAIATEIQRVDDNYVAEVNARLIDHHINVGPRVSQGAEQIRTGLPNPVFD